MMLKTILSTSLAALGVLLPFSAVHAQAPMADRFVKRFEGRWINDRGRTINFEVRDLLAKFTDEVEPGFIMTGSYGQGDVQADLVLSYPTGNKCRYQFAFPVNGRGNEMTLTLLKADTTPDGPQRFRCLQSGTLRRAN